MSNISIIAFDTETTGLVSDFKTDSLKMNLQVEPFVVQLAWVVASIDTATGKFEIIKQVNHLILPRRSDTASYDEMPQQAFDVHHKSYEDCMLTGIHMNAALQELQNAIVEFDVTCLVAHNARYDTRMLD